MNQLMRYKNNLWLGFKVIVSCFCVVALVACGGGKASTSSSSPGLVLTLVDGSGTAVTNMVIGNSYTLKATATSTGGLASGVIVTFSGGSLSTLSPSTGTALTNGSGLAQMTIIPTTAGAATATASATVTVTTTTAATATSPATTTTSTVSVTGSLNYSVSAQGAAVSPSLVLSLVDAGGSAVTNMVVGSSYRLQATVSGSSGLAPNVVVTFSISNAALAVTIPSNGTALTSSLGLAQIVVTPLSAGATTATATAVASGTTVTASQNFSVTSLTTSLSALAMGSASLASAGTTTTSVNVSVNGVLTSGVAVQFVPSCGQVSASSVTSNGSGAASVTYNSVNSNGTFCSGNVTMQASTSGVSVFGTINVASPTITLGTLTPSSASLASAGSTPLALDVFANGALATTNPVSVALTTTCGVITPNVITSDGSGHVAATYSSIKADGTLCQGTSTLTATASNVSTSNTLTVAAPTTGVINFIGASPTQIYLGSSGASSQATLTFKVLSSGVIQTNLPVKLTLVANPGGVTFGTSGNTAPVTVNSDSSGLVTVTVFSGGTPGPVTIQAEWVSNSAINTTSNNFTIASGPPQQRRFSLSVAKFNIEAAEIDGVTTTLTAQVADANGNAVPAGTVVQFVAASGQITSSCTTTVNTNGFSTCSVTFMSQNPRPSNGRVAVLAYVEGIKNYTDNNSNNQFDAGIDTVTDQGDAYRDDNEDGAYTTGEFVVTRGGSTVCAGAGGAAPSRANTCTGTSTVATTVRAQTIILYSSNVATASAVTVTPFSTTAAQSFTFRLNGTLTPLLPMPAATSVTVTSLKAGCSVGTLIPSSVPIVSPGSDPLANIGSQHSVVLTGTAATGSSPAVVCSGGSLQITTTSPSGVATTTTVAVP